MYGPTHLPKGSAVRKVTVPEIRDRKTQGPSIAMVTAYDFTMARLVDEAGVDIVLVGDSLGMVVQGLANTLPVTLDEVCYHGRSVARALRRAHLVRGAGGEHVDQRQLRHLLRLLLLLQAHVGGAVSHQ